MSRFQFPPPAPTTFPIAATTVTDNFQRADENPIGAPWDTSIWTGAEAKIASNLFVSSDRTGYWDGGATYGANRRTEVEVIAQTSTDLSSLANGQIELGFLKTSGIGVSVVLKAGQIIIFENFGDLVELSSVPIVQAPGDNFGSRIIGTNVSSWYLPSGTTQWIKKGEASFSQAYAGLSYLYVYAEDGLVAISEFRVAEVGEIITPHPAMRSRGGTW